MTETEAMRNERFIVASLAAPFADADLAALRVAHAVARANEALPADAHARVARVIDDDGTATIEARRARDDETVLAPEDGDDEVARWLSALVGSALLNARVAPRDEAALSRWPSLGVDRADDAALLASLRTFAASARYARSWDLDLLRLIALSIDGDGDRRARAAAHWCAHLAERAAVEPETPPLRVLRDGDGLRFSDGGDDLARRVEEAASEAARCGLTTAVTYAATAWFLRAARGERP